MIAPPYTVVFNQDARDFFASRRVDDKIKRIILNKIDVLAQNPYWGEPLGRDFHGYRKLKAGQFRVVYRVEEARMLVHIASVGLRRDAYGGS